MPSPSQPLVDTFGRQIHNVRVSVTDRCNFRCTYCMPEEGLDWLDKGDILSYEEIAEIVRILTGLGVEKVRITGGEPLVRKDLHVLVGKLHGIAGLRDLSLTTNGVLLAQQAPALAAAGLRRVNVSLDSLTRETFQRIARRDALEAVLAGLEAAGRHFPGPVKVNAVLLRGVNDHEIPAFVDLTRRHGLEVRFIEFMPLDADATWSRDLLVPGSEALRRIAALHELAPDPDASPSAPSRDFVFVDGAPGKVGFIDSVSQPFCDQCNRIRITADGKLRTCLFSVEETDLMAILRGGSSREERAREIARVVRAAVWKKEPGHRIGQADFVRANRSMSQIGG
ncbi:MAG: GTP 3',8-cyclase MoaA [Planctomycetota bacterium]|nr:GTP 3',8-cyclase MoaA [Planctomycetota bacterium]